MSFLPMLSEMLSSVSLDRRVSPWFDVVSLLSRAFPESVGLFYDLAATERAPSVDRLVSSRPLPGAAQLIDHSLMTEGHYGAYQPLRPEQAQRNRALLLSEVATPEEKARWRLSWRRWDMERSDQLRVLVCDGELMLGWVGVFRPDGQFTAKDRSRLQLFSSTLRNHLRWEAHLQRSEMLEASVEACLESLGRAAALIDERGHVQAENLLMLQRGSDARRAVGEDLKGRGRSRFEFKELRLSGTRGWVAIERSAPLLAPVPRMLTARQRQVLELVLQGHTNRAIAVRLGLSERTVETHLSRIHQEAGCTTRAGLVAACLRR